MANLDRVLSVARSQVGYTESPRGSNRTKYGAWYGMNGAPWCAMFISWVFAQAGSPLPAIQNGKGFASTMVGYNWFKSHGRLHSTPAVGDIVFYNFPGHNPIDHVGIVEAVRPGYIVTLEGNTSGANNANGGMVMRRERRANIAGYGRPDYARQVAPSAPAQGAAQKGIQTFKNVHTTLRVGDRGKSVAHLQEILHLKEDGVFGAETFSKVKATQKFLGVPETGIVDANLWSLIHGSVKRGDTGHRVKELQIVLGLNVDGSFGPATERAVRAYQGWRGLSADGIVSAKTWRSFFN